MYKVAPDYDQNGSLAIGQFDTCLETILFSRFKTQVKQTLLTSFALLISR